MRGAIGRIVHYYEDEGGALAGPFAAIICGVDTVASPGAPLDGVTVCSLAVFPPAAFAIRTGVQQSEEPKARHWMWPPII